MAKKQPKKTLLSFLKESNLPHIDDLLTNQVELAKYKSEIIEEDSALTLLADDHSGALTYTTTRHSSVPFLDKVFLSERGTRLDRIVSGILATFDVPAQLKEADPPSVPESLRPHGRFYYDILSHYKNLYRTQQRS